MRQPHSHYWRHEQKALGTIAITIEPSSSRLRGRTMGDGSVYVTSSAICIVLSQPQTGHRTEKRYDVEKKKRNK